VSCLFFAPPLQSLHLTTAPRRAAAPFRCLVLPLRCLSSCLVLQRESVRSRIPVRVEFLLLILDAMLTPITGAAAATAATAGASAATADAGAGATAAAAGATAVFTSSKPIWRVEGFCSCRLAAECPSSM
jgi:hypothetical protein